MKLNLPTLHLIIGLLGILTFLLTGQYMDLVHNHLVDTPDGRRMLYRSAHIYLLLTSCLNVCIGVYATNLKFSLIQGFISVVILLGPLMMLLEFFYGATDVNSERYFSYYSLISILAAVGLMILRHLLGKWAARNSGSTD